MRGCLLLLTAFVAFVDAYNNGRGGVPPMGWNTWCTGLSLCGLADICTEREIMTMADAIVAQGLDKIGYEYVNMDDCWSATNRTANGSLIADPNRFPNGMAFLADYVHKLGLKIGLYTCVGSLTCRYGRPGSYGHFEQDAETLASWGIDFVKADNCATPGSVPDEELYTNFSRALNATGRPILFSLCNWGIDGVETWGGTLGQMYRVQMDHYPIWDFPPLGAGAGFGQGTGNVIEFMGYLKPSQYVRQYAWMDTDFLGTMFPVTMDLTNSRTEFSFWSIWSAPLIVTTDIRNMSQDMSYILTNTEVIAINQDPLFVGGDRVYNDSNGCQVWTRPLANGDLCVLFYNPHNILPYHVDISWEVVGWPSAASVAVRDLWTHSDLGTFQGGFKTRLLIAHDCQMLRCTLQGSTTSTN